MVSVFPISKEQEEVQEMKKYITILNKMTVLLLNSFNPQPLQLAKPQTIKAQDRVKLAQDSELVGFSFLTKEQTVEYVNKVLRMYDQQLGRILLV